jgi:hypothetical protein
MSDRSNQSDRSDVIGRSGLVHTSSNLSGQSDVTIRQHAAPPPIFHTSNRETYQNNVAGAGSSYSGPPSDILTNTYQTAELSFVEQLNIATTNFNFSANMLSSVTNNRSNLLRMIQNTLGDGKVSREMRAFCELCEEANLNPLAAMSKDELLALSDNCKKAIWQCEHYISKCFENTLTFSSGHRRVRYMDGDTRSITSRSTTSSSRVCYLPQHTCQYQSNNIK